MSLLDSIQDFLGGAGDQVNSSIQDAGSQITDVTDQIQETKDTILPGSEEGENQ